MSPSATHPAPSSKAGRWAGVILTALPVLFLIFDGVIKLLELGPVVESFARLGYPVSVAVEIGLLELALVAVYLAPRTAVLGAILLTGYLGGAVSTHVRVGDPLFSHVLFPIYLGVLLWGGLLLRDHRLRAAVLSRRLTLTRGARERRSGGDRGARRADPLLQRPTP